MASLLSARRPGLSATTACPGWRKGFVSITRAAAIAAERPSIAVGSYQIAPVRTALQLWHNSCLPGDGAGPPRDSRQHPCPRVGPNLSSVRLGPKSEVGKTLKIRPVKISQRRSRSGGRDEVPVALPHSTQLMSHALSITSRRQSTLDEPGAWAVAGRQVHRDRGRRRFHVA
jgi:hypothetical protein